MRKDIADLLTLIKIESVQSDPLPNAPFGKKSRDALDFYLGLAQSMGFSTYDVGGYAGEIDYGDGEETVGVLAHLDVVPLGEGWTKEQGTVSDGRIYGRGAVDDKGPAMACLYALKKIRDSNKKLKRKIRIIVGCNEENGNQCMKHYVKTRPLPDISFTPDSDFPVIICEKGILQLNISIPRSPALDGILSMSGGERHNVVCAACSFTMEDTPANQLKLKRLIDHNVEFKYIAGDGILKFIFSGKPAHAAEVWKGDNAVWKMLNALKLLSGGADTALRSVIDLLASPVADKNLGIACNDERSGFTTMNIGKVGITPESLQIMLDIRMPIPLTKEMVIGALEAKLPEGSAVSIHYNEGYLYVDKDSELMQKLKRVFTKCSALPYTEIITGGGTYARQLKNCVAFGAMFKDEEYNMHNADENITLEHYDFLQYIYYEAILSLASE